MLMLLPALVVDSCRRTRDRLWGATPIHRPSRFWGCWRCSIPTNG